MLAVVTYYEIKKTVVPKRYYGYEKTIDIKTYAAFKAFSFFF